MEAQVFHPEGPGPWPGVLFFMDAYGLRPDLNGMAERLANRGYLVVLPNLYYRVGEFPPFNPLTVFGDPGERARLMALVQSLRNADVIRDIAAARDFLKSQTHVRPGPLGCVGYCMGGRFALLAAGSGGEDIAAAASFHGGSLATEKPDSPHLWADRMRARLYIGVAGLDANFTPEEKARLENALSAVGVRYTLETYPEVRHGFAVTGSAVYDRAASERHWEALFAFFQETLG